MNNLIMEIIGRYVLTGVILWGIVFVMMTVRLAYKTLKSGNYCKLEGFSDGVKVKKKASVPVRIIRYVVWPYGIIKVIHMYMKEENRIFSEE